MSGLTLDNLPETNRRHASPLGARREFRVWFHAHASVFGGGRSAKRYAR
jgi:hypothetical protein